MRQYRPRQKRKRDFTFSGSSTLERSPGPSEGGLANVAQDTPELPEPVPGPVGAPDVGTSGNLPELPQITSTWGTSEVGSAGQDGIMAKLTALDEKLDEVLEAVRDLKKLPARMG